MEAVQVYEPELNLRLSHPLSGCNIFPTRFLLTTVQNELNSTDEITVINQMYRKNVARSSLNNFHSI
jgi:hypothetical protein